MKHNAVVLAARPARIVRSLRKSAIRGHVPVTLWETHSWMKRIIKLRKQSRISEEFYRNSPSRGGSLPFKSHRH
jgi:hypothetical protein